MMSLFHVKAFKLCGQKKLSILMLKVQTYIFTLCIKSYKPKTTSPNEGMLFLYFEI